MSVLATLVAFVDELPPGLHTEQSHRDLRAAHYLLRTSANAGAQTAVAELLASRFGPGRDWRAVAICVLQSGLFEFTTP